MNISLLLMTAYYKLISSEFIQAYSTDPSQFQQLIKTAFDKSRDIDNKHGIDIMFLQILDDENIEWSVEQIKHMIELGADPRYHDDDALFRVGHYSTSDVAAYLIENYNMIIDSCSIQEIFTYGVKATIDTLRLFLDTGNTIEDRHIYKMIGRCGIIDVLVEKGYDIKKILDGISHNPKQTEGKDMYRFIIEQLKKEELNLDKVLVNNLFLFAIGTGMVTVDDLPIFINAGMDPGYQNDKFFVWLCKFGYEIPSYFINEYGADVNAYKGYALTNALTANNPLTIKFLLESGIKVTDQHIIYAFDNPENLEMLMKYSDITGEQISELLVKKLFDKNVSTLRIAKTYINNDVDFNQIILGLTIDNV